MVALTSEPAPAIARVDISLRWTRGELATFWLLHPSASDFVDHPPCRHRSDGAIAPLKLLVAAMEADAQLSAPGPAFFVVPELTISPDEISDLRDATARLGANRVAIVGLGHLTREQCDAIEPSVGSDAALWRRDWDPLRYANAAAICVGGRMWLEAKDWPSKFEDDAGCHLPHRRVRIFRGANTSFAVLICSEMLPAYNPDAFLRALAREQVEVVFWLQHNPSPRNEAFQRGLGAFYETQRESPLVVAVNKQPVSGTRAPYGVSAMYAPSACFAQRKDSLLRPNFVVEPLYHNSGVSRAVFVRYDTSAHQILTIHPADVPRESPPGAFLREVAPFSFGGGVLKPDNTPRHFQAIFAQGRLGAMREAELEETSVDPTLSMQLGIRLAEVESELSGSANGLLNFLDSALLQQGKDLTHPNSASHVLASQCDCWPHREDFDTLFDPTNASGVAELALAIAAMRHSVDSVELALTHRTEENLKIVVRGKEHRVLLGSSLLRLDEYRRRRSASSRPTTCSPKVIVLRSVRHTILPPLASQTTTVSQVNAAVVQNPEPATLVGAELWRGFREGRLRQTIEAFVGADT